MATLPPRRPGRPVADSGDRREHLLDVALDLFSRHGVAGTSLAAIAAGAGVNPALVHYYFGGRQQMQQVVFVERVMPAIDSVVAAVEPQVTGDDADDPAALARRFVDAMAAMVAHRPWFPSLWIREVVCDGGALRDALLAHIVQARPQRLVARFAQAQQADRLAPGIEPRLLMVSLIGLTLFASAAGPVWRRLFDADDIDDAALAAHAIALLEAGLRPPATAGRSIGGAAPGRRSSRRTR